MKRIFVPTTGPEDWKKFLAEPEKQWRTGFSARTLANCWESAEGFPPEVEAVFNHSGFTEFQNLQPLMAFPEYKVYLPPRGHPSQNDLFVLARNRNADLVTIAVEGKVSEPFGETLAEWDATSSKGRRHRLAYLQNLLGLDNIPQNIRYQLLHRSASAILEAQKFNAKCAVLLVHSFSPETLWLDDFLAFTRLYGVQARADNLYLLRDLDGICFYAAWVKGDERFLKA